MIYAVYELILGVLFLFIAKVYWTNLQGWVGRYLAGWMAACGLSAFGVAIWIFSHA